MTEPIVTKVVGADGVERWGSTTAKWVRDGIADGSLSDPAAAPKVSEEKPDAPSVPADGDGPNPSPRKR